MSNKEKVGLTKNERKRISEAYYFYVNGRFSYLSNFVIILVGFCLATLSASNISPVINFIMMLVVLILFLIFMLKERNNPDVSLKGVLSELTDKYQNKENKDEAIQEINSYNVWDGFSNRTIGANLPILLSVLFALYTLIEHGLRAWCP